MKYVYANEPIIAPEVATYECCAQDFCNGNVEVLSYVLSSSLARMSALLFVAVSLLSYVVLMQ
eukprot:gene9708-7576_t